MLEIILNILVNKKIKVLALGKKKQKKKICSRFILSSGIGEETITTKLVNYLSWLFMVI